MPKHPLPSPRERILQFAKHYDIEDRPFIEVWNERRFTLRIWMKTFAWPYYWHRWGVYSFGAFWFGCNLWLIEPGTKEDGKAGDAK